LRFRWKHRQKAKAAGNRYSPVPTTTAPVLDPTNLSGKVASVVGFFRSDDGGKSFVRINDDAHQYGGSNLIIGDPRVYCRVYLAGHGRGVLYGEPR
jgi:hypothetical protein